MSDKKPFWIGFNLVKGIGPARLRALLEYFGDIETAWQAPASQLYEAGLGKKTAQGLLQVRGQIEPERLYAETIAAGIQVLTWDDPEYPQRLREIEHPPPVLYMRGAFTDEDTWAVAIVGTRRVTKYGQRAAEELAAHLARRGITVVSGLARGTDTIAHRAALDAGGRTIGVLGSGVDRIYPPENRLLAEKMAGQGAVLSDYAVGTPPDGPNFPPRNRIISGLSTAVVVIEAGLRSGAQITATFAADQGREVFAVPGSIYAPQSAGTNRLIEQGARPYLSPDELVEALEMTNVTQYQQVARALPANETEEKLYKLLKHEPLHADEISAAMELPVSEVTAALTVMELKGLVRQVSGMSYLAI